MSNSRDEKPNRAQGRSRPWALLIRREPNSPWEHAPGRSSSKKGILGLAEELLETGKCYTYIAYNMRDSGVAEPRLFPLGEPQSHAAGDAGH